MWYKVEVPVLRFGGQETYACSVEAHWDMAAVHEGMYRAVKAGFKIAGEATVKRTRRPVKKG